MVNCKCNFNCNDAGSYLVLALKVLQKSFVEICGDAVEQRPQHSLRKLVIVQVFGLHRTGGTGVPTKTSTTRHGGGQDFVMMIQPI